MSLDAQVAVLRSAAGLSSLNHVAAIRVAGAGAFDLLSSLSSRQLFLRETQVLHTLFLRADGKPLFDVYVGYAEDDAYYLLAEGGSAHELVDHAVTVQRPSSDVRIDDLSSQYVLWGIDGPYAWEVTAALLGPRVLGMPYLTLLHFEEGMCFRVGKTGEYGYALLIERASAEAFSAKMEERGRPLGLEPVTLAALDLCALENWHFSMRTLRETSLASPLTPLELQLQWRVSYEHEHVGGDALRERRARGTALRATCFTAERGVAAGAAVYLDEQCVGEVLAADWSPTCHQWIGIALLGTAIAHPGIDALRVGDERAVIATRTPPLVRNASLFVDPHRHSFLTRHSDGLPALMVTT